MPYNRRLSAKHGSTRMMIDVKVTRDSFSDLTGAWRSSIMPACIELSGSSPPLSLFLDRNRFFGHFISAAKVTCYRCIPCASDNFPPELHTI